MTRMRTSLAHWRSRAGRAGLADTRGGFGAAGARSGGGRVGGSARGNVITLIRLGGSAGGESPQSGRGRGHARQEHVNSRPERGALDARAPAVGVQDAEG